MIFESELKAYLLTIPALTALVHSRIYGILRQQSQDLPAILIQRVQTTRQPKFCATDKLVSSDIQIDAYAISGDSGWALAAALRATLLDFTGTMGAAYVDKVMLTNEFPLNDPDPGVIRITQLYNFWYVED